MVNVVTRFYTSFTSGNNLRSPIRCRPGRLTICRRLRGIKGRVTRFTHLVIIFGRICVLNLVTLIEGRPRGRSTRGRIPRRMTLSILQGKVTGGHTCTTEGQILTNLTACKRSNFLPFQNNHPPADLVERNFEVDAQKGRRRIRPEFDARPTDELQGRVTSFVYKFHQNQRQILANL